MLPACVHALKLCPNSWGEVWMYGYYRQGVSRGVRARQCEFVFLYGALAPFRAWHVTSNNNSLV
jgi:hypothetical protein